MTYFVLSGTLNHNSINQCLFVIGNRKQAKHMHAHTHTHTTYHTNTELDYSNYIISWCTKMHWNNTVQ